MATGWMPSGADATLKTINWDTDDIRCAMLLSSYSFSAAHDFLDDISADVAVNGTSGNLNPGITVASGVIDVGDFTITPDTAQSVASLMFYQHTGTESTAALLFFLDSAKVSNLPLTTTGAAVSIVIDNGTFKFLSLTPILT